MKRRQSGQNIPLAILLPQYFNAFHLPANYPILLGRFIFNRLGRI